MTTQARTVHPRCRGVSLKLAIYFQHYHGAVSADRLINEAGLNRPNIEGAMLQGLLEKEDNEYRLTEYATKVLYR